MTGQALGYGSYWLCTRTDPSPKRLWQRDDTVVIFSNTDGENVDLLFENGKTLANIPATDLQTNFRFLFIDENFIIDGCSTNPGWQRAAAMRNE